MRIQTIICMKYLLLLLSLILLQWINIYPAEKASASSPSFVRQEILDNTEDRIFNPYYQDKAYKENDAGLEELIPSFIDVLEGTRFLDIFAVNYHSDGKALNTTIWLKGSVNPLNWYLPESFSISSVTYGILIDVDNNEKTGREGIDYDSLIQWNAVADRWGSLFAEHSSGNISAPVIESQRHYNLTRDFVRLSLDLDRLSSPTNYRMMFYTIAEYESDEGGLTGRIIDFTSWVNVPPQDYILKTSPNPVIARQGETTKIAAQLMSATGFIPEVIDFNTPKNHSDIKIEFISGGENKKKTYGIEPAPFDIEVPADAQIGNYVIPLLANISTGATFPATFSSVEVASLLPSQGYSIGKANLTIDVMPPLSYQEQFKQFWDDYGDFISLLAGGFAAGLSALAVDKLKERLKGNNRQEHHQLSDK
jgi:hypothetical protein